MHPLWFDLRFTRQLRPAVNAERVRFARLVVGPVGVARKDVVGRNVDQRGVRSRSRTCQITHRQPVDPIGCRLVLLGPVDVGVGGAVDDHVDPPVAHRPPDGFLVGNIQLRHIRKTIFVPRRRSQQPHGVPQLSVGTRYENPTHNSPYYNRTTPCTRQRRVTAVLRREDHLLGAQPPVDPDRGVVPGDRPLAFGSIEVVAFVLEYRLVAQHRKTVGEPARNEELTFVLCRQLHGDMTAEGGRAAADVDRHVQHLSLHHAHQFRLSGAAALEVQPPQHAEFRFRFVVLYETHGTHGGVEARLIVTFEKVTPIIAEYVRLDNHHSFDLCLNDFHVLSKLTIRPQGPHPVQRSICSSCFRRYCP